MAKIPKLPKAWASGFRKSPTKDIHRYSKVTGISRSTLGSRGGNTAGSNRSTQAQLRKEDKARLFKDVEDTAPRENLDDEIERLQRRGYMKSSAYRQGYMDKMAQYGISKDALSARGLMPAGVVNRMHVLGQKDPLKMLTDYFGRMRADKLTRMNASNLGSPTAAEIYKASPLLAAQHRRQNGTTAEWMLNRLQGAGEANSSVMPFRQSERMAV